MREDEQEPIPMAELQEHWQQQDGDQQTQLTRLHQVKADAQTLVRPMRTMTVENDGLPAVQTARKAVVKMRTSVDKRRKALNDEAQQWIKTVNGVAKEITGILEPVEEHLKQQEALEADRQRRAEEAEQAERAAVRRMGWPAELGQFPELQARTVTASEWQTLVMQKSIEAAEAKRKAEEEAAMRAELERLRQLAREAEAERQKMAAEIEAARKAEQAAEEAARRAEQAAAEAARRPEPVSIQVVETEPEPIEQPAAIANPFLRHDSGHQPPTPAVKLFAGTGRDDRTRLRDLIKRLAEITAQQGDVDWRADINQAMQEAME